MGLPNEQLDEGLRWIETALEDAEDELNNVPGSAQQDELQLQAHSLQLDELESFVNSHPALSPTSSPRPRSDQTRLEIENLTLRSEMDEMQTEHRAVAAALAGMQSEAEATYQIRTSQLEEALSSAVEKRASAEDAAAEAQAQLAQLQQQSTVRAANSEEIVDCAEAAAVTGTESIWNFHTAAAFCVGVTFGVVCVKLRSR